MRWRVGLAAAALAALVLAHGQAPAGPSGNRGLIVFASSRAITVMRPDGTGRRLVVKGSPTHTTPSWAPEASRIVFSRYVSRLYHPKWSIFVTDRNDRSARRVTSGFTPAWSPRGDWIVFVDTSLNVEALFVVRPNGKGRTRLTNPRRVYDSDPKWSPDGTRVLFVRGDGNGSGSFYTVDLRGHSLSRLTRVRTDSSPEWSPNGRWIAFVRAQRIFVMRSDGSGVRRLSRTPRGWQYLEWFDGSPSWSPDSQALVFSRYLEEPGMSPRHQEIYVMRRDGSGVVRLTYSRENQYTPDWAPLP
jgi:Tol biopolymer transport system component